MPKVLGEPPTFTFSQSEVSTLSANFLLIRAIRVIRG